MHPAWLKTPFTDAEVAALGRPRGRVTRAARPMVTALQAFKARLQPGDEVWSYDAPQAAWQDLHGERGLAIVRAGQVVETLVLMEN